MNDFLKSIKDDIGEQKFNELMLADGGATLIFAVDTTGSMADEIAAARGIANAIINMPRKFPVDYILSPFNDPGECGSHTLLQTTSFPCFSRNLFLCEIEAVKFWTK